MGDIGTYVFVGWAYGQFEDKHTGKMVNYANMFVTSPVGDSRDGYQAGGQKAEKLKCVSPEVFANLTLGETVQLFFNARNQVALATSV